MKFTFAGTTPHQKHGKMCSLKEAGPVRMLKVFQMLKTEMLRWKRILNTVLQLMDLEKDMLYFDWPRRKMLTLRTNTAI